jgi:hypothetical protein
MGAAHAVGMTKKVSAVLLSTPHLRDECFTLKILKEFE